jgi:hypothetical protein
MSGETPGDMHVPGGSSARAGEQVRRLLRDDGGDSRLCLVAGGLGVSVRSSPLAPSRV